MRTALPTFAVVGAVNHGKSSVVAALAEDDQVRVSPMPGETVVTQRFGLRDLLVFYDTPGFQNARKTLAAIEAERSGDDPLAPFRLFIERHRHDPSFEAECRLLQPVVDGAGILYVVDGSRPLRDIHGCEMEILRRTGAPRLAIINRTGDDDHVAAWRGRLDQHFNIVREFDAHRVTFADRKDLVESLAIIERAWREPLGRAVQAMDDDRAQRIQDAAREIADLIAACLVHVEKERAAAVEASMARAAQAEALRARYMASIGRLERDAHRRIIALYAHRHVTPEALPDAIFESDLFSEETWQLCGLGVRQLVAVSAVGGGMAGAAVDAATLGHSLGAGAAIGAASGMAGAWWVGRKRPEIAVAWRPLSRMMTALGPAAALRFGGADVVVGPYRAENFPWILIDRALCVFVVVATRSHARRDEVSPDTSRLLASLRTAKLSVADWSDTARASCQRAFRGLGAGKGDSIEPLQVAITEALSRIIAEPQALEPLSARVDPA